MYTEENILGLKVRHKDYKIGNPMGEYEVGYDLTGSNIGIWFQMNITSQVKTNHSSYSLDQMNSNIERRDWIPILSEVINQYEIY